MVTNNTSDNYKKTSSEKVNDFLFSPVGTGLRWGLASGLVFGPVINATSAEKDNNTVVINENYNKKSVEEMVAEGNLADPFGVAPQDTIPKKKKGQQDPEKQKATFDIDKWFDLSDKVIEYDADSAVNEDLGPIKKFTDYHKKAITEMNTINAFFKNPGAITPDKYTAIKEKLSELDSIYTTGKDSLLMWIPNINLEQTKFTPAYENARETGESLKVSIEKMLSDVWGVNVNNMNLPQEAKEEEPKEESDFFKFDKFSMQPGYKLLFLNDDVFGNTKSYATLGIGLANSKGTKVMAGVLYNAGRDDSQTNLDTMIVGTGTNDLPDGMELHAIETEKSDIDPTLGAYIGVMQQLHKNFAVGAGYTFLKFNKTDAITEKTTIGYPAIDGFVPQTEIDVNNISYDRSAHFIDVDVIGIIPINDKFDFYLTGKAQYDVMKNTVRPAAEAQLNIKF